MAGRYSAIFAIGLIVLALLCACSSNQSTNAVVPTLAVLPAANLPSQIEATTPPDVQGGVDQLFTQTAQAQQLIAPTETVIAAFNQALTETARPRLFATASSVMAQNLTIEALLDLTATALKLTPFASITPLTGLSGGAGVTQPANPTCPPPTGWIPYTVEAGDSIGALADATGATITGIVDGNCLSDPNTLFTGQVLYLPRRPNTG